MPVFEHKGLGIKFTVPDDLRQRDVEAFFKARRELQGEGDVSSPEYCGIIARVVARLGWVDGIDEDGVGDMKPGAVIWLSRKAQAEVMASIAIPPE